MSDRCRFCGADEIYFNSPATKYECGTTDYDGTNINQSVVCKVRQLESDNAELKEKIQVYESTLDRINSRTCERCKYDKCCEKEIIAYDEDGDFSSKVKYCSLYEEAEE